MNKAIIFSMAFLLLASIISSLASSQSLPNYQAQSPNAAVSQPSFFSRVTNLFGGSNPNPQTPPAGEDAPGQGKLSKGQGIQNVDAPAGLDAVPCEDTDNGLSFATAGAVQGKMNRGDGEPTIYYDSCGADPKTLIEYYCNPWTGLVKFHKIYCKSGCVDGSCPNNPFCISTDNNNNPKMKGSLILIKANEEDLPEGSIAQLKAKDLVEIVQDYCMASDKTKVVQHTCDASPAGYSEVISNCESGKECMGGICGTPILAPENKPLLAPGTKSMWSGMKSMIGFGGSKEAAMSASNDAIRGRGTDDGSTECEDGETVVLNGISCTCDGDELTCPLKLYRGYHQWLGYDLVLPNSP